MIWRTAASSPRIVALINGECVPQPVRIPAAPSVNVAMMIDGLIDRMIQRNRDRPMMADRDYSPTKDAVYTR